MQPSVKLSPSSSTPLPSLWPVPPPPLLLRPPVPAALPPVETPAEAGEPPAPPVCDAPPALFGVDSESPQPVETVVTSAKPQPSSPGRNATPISHIFQRIAQLHNCQLTAALREARVYDTRLAKEGTGSSATG